MFSCINLSSHTWRRNMGSGWFPATRIASGTSTEALESHWKQSQQIPVSFLSQALVPNPPRIYHWSAYPPGQKKRMLWIWMENRHSYMSVTCGWDGSYNVASWTCLLAHEIDLHFLRLQLPSTISQQLTTRLMTRSECMLHIHAYSWKERNPF